MKHLIFIFTFFCGSLLGVPVHAAALVQPAQKSFVLPPRKNNHGTSQARSQFMSLKTVAVQKPRGKSKTQQVTKEVVPSGDNDKLLLYVFNDLH